MMEKRKNCADAEHRAEIGADTDAEFRVDAFAVEFADDDAELGADYYAVIMQMPMQNLMQVLLRTPV